MWIAELGAGPAKQEKKSQTSSEDVCEAGAET